MTAHLYPEERRSATILFADIQGFTRLSEQLDYETVSDLIKELWSRLDSIIEDTGGYLDKHMGDGVMAVWGAPYATDRDAEKAVHAARAMIETLNIFLKNSSIPGTDQLNLRVGINSGQVFAGYIGTRNEYTVIGDTVNVAARLEQAADPGTVIVGEGTSLLIRRIFELQELPPVHAKGKTEPIKAYQVTGTRPSSRVTYESLDRLETHMVGRDTEMTRLRIHYEQSRTSITPALLLVTGEVGIGKSRLLLEFSKKLQRDIPAVQLYSTRALAQTSRVPYNVWKQLLYRIFELQDNQSPAQILSKLTFEITRLWDRSASSIPASDAINTMGKLIGLAVNDEGVRANEALSAKDEMERAGMIAHAILHRIMLKGPLVLIVDDLHWADKESLTLLLSLSNPGAEPLSAVIIGGTRLSLLKDFPQWWNASQIITLNPLAFTTEMVATAYPDLKSFPEPLLDELANRAEGNPYFLEEIIKGLLKTRLDGIDITPEEAISHIQSQIPESLRAMLQARLDNLSRESRSIALMASVVGRVFWVGAIREITRTASDTGALSALPDEVLGRLLQDGLRQLVRAEMAFPRTGTQFSDQQEYIFKNSYLRDVAYSMIPHRNRSNYHRAVGLWLSRFEGTIHNVMAAEHFEKSGDYQWAVEQYDRALAAAISRNSLGEIESLSIRSLAARESGRKVLDHD